VFVTVRGFSKIDVSFSEIFFAEVLKLSKRDGSSTRCICQNLLVSFVFFQMSLLIVDSQPPQVTRCPNSFQVFLAVDQVAKTNEMHHPQAANS
jgi:hypothetical protein